MEGILSILYKQEQIVCVILQFSSLAVTQGWSLQIMTLSLIAT